MTNIVAVITGSTRGIGSGLAREFLKHGHSVMISGQSQESVNRAISSLSDFAPDKAKINGFPCDIRNYTEIEILWSKAIEIYGKVNIWINNAGVINTMRPIGELSQDDVENVPLTNLVGMMNGCMVALNGMLQQGYGQLYTFEGFGSNGSKNQGLSIYGSSKYGLRYFTKCLIEETKDSPVLVGSLSPGIVTTDLLFGAKNEVTAEQWKKMTFVYRILADEVDTVAPFLVKGVLQNKKHGAQIEWLTRRKAFLRFIKHFLFKKRKVLPGLE